MWAGSSAGQSTGLISPRSVVQVHPRPPRFRRDTPLANRSRICYYKLCMNDHLRPIDAAPDGTPPRQPVLHRLRQFVVSAVQRLFTTQIPLDLQQRGLTPEVYEAIAKQYSDMLRGYRKHALRNIQQKRKNGDISAYRAFVRQLEAEGYSAEVDRKHAILDALMEEYGFNNDTHIPGFLRTQLAPPPYLT